MERADPAADLSGHVGRVRCAVQPARSGHRGLSAVPYHRPADVQLLPREHDHGHGERAKERPAAAQGLYSQIHLPAGKVLLCARQLLFQPRGAVYRRAADLVAHLDRDCAAGHLSPCDAVYFQSGHRADFVHALRFCA